jgi:hypothetical protein
MKRESIANIGEPGVPGRIRRGAGLLAGLALVLGPVAGWADVGDAKTIATGLSNPRGLNFAPNGELYVAENGRGGAGPCIPSPVLPVNRCYGETGSIARILPNGGFERILTGLPSLALPDGTSEGGPADVAFHGAAAYVVIGLGGNPAVRAGLPPNGALLGKVLRVTPSGRYQVIADVAAHEATANPGGGAIDSNPYGIAPMSGRMIIADAGGNSVIEVAANGSVRTFAIPGAPGAQSVPTSVVEGPDGALYVGLLTGFPFFRGAAQVVRISSDGASVDTFLGGLTAVVDITFDAGGALYVLEIASGHTGPFPPNPGLGNGRLLRKCPGLGPEVLLTGLTYAAGVAIGPDDAAYLTNFGTSSTNGEVLRLPLAPCPM